MRLLVIVGLIGLIGGCATEEEGLHPPEVVCGNVEAEVVEPHAEFIPAGPVVIRLQWNSIPDLDASVVISEDLPPPRPDFPPTGPAVRHADRTSTHPFVLPGDKVFQVRVHRFCYPSRDPIDMPRIQHLGGAMFRTAPAP
jgi:hypothetical protein